MKEMKKRKVFKTPEKKAIAAYAQKHGVEATMKKYGVSRVSVHRWVNGESMGEVGQKPKHRPQPKPIPTPIVHQQAQPRTVTTLLPHPVTEENTRPVRYEEQKIDWKARYEVAEAKFRKLSARYIEDIIFKA